jgi:hypothetical protein
MFNKDAEPAWCRSHRASGEAAVIDDGHYEIELFGRGHPGEGARWRSVMMSPDAAVPMPLVFGSLSEARSYAEQDQPGAVRIVWVMEEGKRLVVETLDP